ncbi:TonB-dependent receptor [candidate division WOR-3 bacterium]|nr:TonB-dependent receptor [candidate division WOR-3 bacterium]
MTTKLLRAAVVLLAAGSPLLAFSGSIEGRVIDDSRRPLPGAHVWLVGLEAGTAADTSGRYFIAVPEPGDFRVVYQHIGYGAETLSVAVGRGERVARDVVLRQTRIGLPPVETRASRQTVHGTNTPEPTVVIPKAAAEQAGKTTIGEAATLETGIQLQKRCSACEASEVSIHGLPGRFSLILLEGTPVFSNLASRYILDLLPVDFLDRLEVLKGASGAIWGSDAIAGAVNILPYQPAERFEARATYARRSYGSDLSGLVGSNVFPLGVSVIGAHGNRDFVDLNGDGSSENSAYRRSLLLANLNYSPGLAWQLNGGGTFGDELRRGGAIVPDSAYYTNPLAERVHTRRWDAWQRTSFTAGDMELTLRLALSRHGEDGVVETRDYSANQTTTYAEFSAGLPHVASGLSFSRQSVADSRLFSRGYAESDFAVWAAGRSITPTVLGTPTDILPALRLDVNSEYGVIPSPYAAVRLYPSFADLNFAVGTGFRTPTVILESMENLPGGYQYAIRRDSALTSESGLSVVAGAGRKLTSQKLITELRANLFYHRIGSFIAADMVGLDSVTRRAVFYYHNLDEVTTSAGAELSASFTVLLGASANVGAYYLHPRSGSNRTLPFVRRWGASYSVSYPYRRWGLELVAGGDVNGPMLVRTVYGNGAIEDHDSPVYATMSLRATKRLGILRIGAGGNNLWNYHQPPLSHHDGETEYYWGPIIGRELYATLSVSI